MSREWQPGDVALVRLVTREKAEPGIYDGDVWTVRKGMTADPIDEPRPLVVIDPEDREQMCRLLDAVSKHGVTPTALRSLIAPPKPEEPTGLGAVVVDERGELWIRRAGGGSPWLHSDGAAFARRWDDLRPVKVLAEGVTK